MPLELSHSNQRGFRFPEIEEYTPNSGYLLNTDVVTSFDHHTSGFVFPVSNTVGNIYLRDSKKV